MHVMRHWAASLEGKEDDDNDNDGEKREKQ